MFMHVARAGGKGPRTSGLSEMKRRPGFVSFVPLLGPDFGDPG
jgi:hypothetical protein